MRQALRLAMTGIAALGLTLPSIAAAQSQCGVVRSILSKDRSKLEGIGVTVNSQGLVDTTQFGVAGILRDAQSCELVSPEYGFDLGCYWNIKSGEERKAKKQFDTLRRSLDDCLPNILEKQEPTQFSDEKLAEFREEYGQGFVDSIQSTEDLEEYDLSVDLNDGDEVKVSLDMSRRKKSGRIVIYFNIYRF